MLFQKLYDRISERISYDSVTGEFSYKYGGYKGVKTGEKPGAKGTITIDRKVYRTGVIAWFLHYKEYPSGDIVHINKNESDHRIDNLRHAERSEACANAKMRSNNSSGYVGVSYKSDKSLYRADIMKNGKAYFLGYYKTAEQAARVRSRAAIRLNGVHANKSLLVD